MRATLCPTATRGGIRIDHPQVGELTLNRERLGLDGTDGLMLVDAELDAATRTGGSDPRDGCPVDFGAWFAAVIQAARTTPPGSR